MALILIEPGALATSAPAPDNLSLLESVRVAPRPLLVTQPPEAYSVPVGGPAGFDWTLDNVPDRAEDRPQS